MKDKLFIAHSGCFRKQKLYGYDQEKKKQAPIHKERSSISGNFKDIKTARKKTRTTININAWDL
ncbi:hypothetical protein EA772_15590 [Pedobacter sp. G11]|uniref:hypothetical protein n=1 Tax=Pedobacter sp. G11 TaxID=2482728 RepID=UPI000F5EBD64|nr:hypothetical protein [Pedobacter sp. G11]AZI26694.1 hypothetical protein EA772_15590 [Pedobacter sp. G11]